MSPLIRLVFPEPSVPVTIEHFTLGLDMWQRFFSACVSSLFALWNERMD